MNTLSRESFSKILYVIPNQNYANIYARLLLELPPVDSALFSKILLRGDGAEWVDEEGLGYMPFSVASDKEKEQIAIFIEDRKNSILKKLSGMEFANDLFTIPSTEQIFFCKDVSGNVKVKLAQWGFKLPRNRDGIDVISALLAQPRSLVQSPVEIAVCYTDGIPAGNESFSLKLFGSTVPFVTDENGHFFLGQIINGKSFTVVDGKGNEKSFVVDPSVKLYEVELPVYTSYEIVVQNQEGTPCQKFPLVVNGRPMVTDNEGRVVSDEFKMTPKMTVEVVHEETTHKETYSLARNPEDNHFRFVYSEKFFSSLEVVVHYPDGEGLANYRLVVGSEEHVTDEYGHLRMDGLEAGSQIRVADASDVNNHIEMELKKGNNTAELIVARKEVKMMRIHMEDKDGNPLPNLPIKLQRKKLEALEGVTDAQGNALFPAELFTNGQKIKIICSYKGRFKLKKLSK